MYGEVQLEIRGYQGRGVPNTFFRQQEAAAGLAVLLPGYAYTTDMPLLYYATALFLDNQFDVLHVQYGYQKEPDFGLPLEKKERQWLLADVSAAVGQGVAQRDYREMVLVGMSLGTLAMGDLVAGSRLGGTTKWVWLSPLLQDERLGEQIISHRPESLFVVGTADGQYRSSVRQQVQDVLPREWLEVAGAGHDLEIGGDIRRTLQAAEAVVCALAHFCECSGCD